MYLSFIEQGEKVDGIYLIHNGHVEIFRKQKKDLNYQMSIILKGKGSLIGLEDYFEFDKDSLALNKEKVNINNTRNGRTYSAICKDRNVKIYKIDKQILDYFIGGYSNFRNYLINLAHQKFIEYKTKYEKNVELKKNLSSYNLDNTHSQQLRRNPSIDVMHLSQEQTKYYTQPSEETYSFFKSEKKIGQVQFEDTKQSFGEIQSRTRIKTEGQNESKKIKQNFPEIIRFEQQNEIKDFEQVYEQTLKKNIKLQKQKTLSTAKYDLFLKNKFDQEFIQHLEQKKKKDDLKKFKNANNQNHLDENNELKESVKDINLIVQHNQTTSIKFLEKVTSKLRSQKTVSFACEQVKEKFQVESEEEDNQKNIFQSNKKIENESDIENHNENQNDEDDDDKKALQIQYKPPSTQNSKLKRIQSMYQMTSSKDTYQSSLNIDLIPTKQSFNLEKNTLKLFEQENNLNKNQKQTIQEQNEDDIDSPNNRGLQNIQLNKKQSSQKNKLNQQRSLNQDFELTFSPDLRKKTKSKQSCEEIQHTSLDNDNKKMENQNKQQDETDLPLIREKSKTFTNQQEKLAQKVILKFKKNKNNNILSPNLNSLNDSANQVNQVEISQVIENNDQSQNSSDKNNREDKQQLLTDKQQLLTDKQIQQENSEPILDNTQNQNNKYELNDQIINNSSILANSQSTQQDKSTDISQITENLYTVIKKKQDYIDNFFASKKNLYPANLQLSNILGKNQKKQSSSLENSPFMKKEIPPQLNLQKNNPVILPIIKRQNSFNSLSTREQLKQQQNKISLFVSVKNQNQTARVQQNKSAISSILSQFRNPSQDNEEKKLNNITNQQQKQKNISNVLNSMLRSSVPDLVSKPNEINKIEDEKKQYYQALKSFRMNTDESKNESDIQNICNESHIQSPIFNKYFYSQPNSKKNSIIEISQADMDTSQKKSHQRSISINYETQNTNTLWNFQNYQATTNNFQNNSIFSCFNDDEHTQGSIVKKLMQKSHYNSNNNIVYAHSHNQNFSKPTYQQKMMHMKDQIMDNISSKMSLFPIKKKTIKILKDNSLRKFDSIDIQKYESPKGFGSPILSNAQSQNQSIDFTNKSINYQQDLSIINTSYNANKNLNLNLDLQIESNNSKGFKNQKFYQQINSSFMSPQFQKTQQISEFKQISLNSPKKVLNPSQKVLQQKQFKQSGDYIQNLFANKINSGIN